MNDIILEVSNMEPSSPFNNNEHHLASAMLIDEEHQEGDIKKEFLVNRTDSILLEDIRDQMMRSQTKQKQ
jgi:hypothetical protein